MARTEGAPRQPNFRSANLYEFVGVDPYAATGEIKEQIRKLIGQYHPDKHQGASAAVLERNNGIVQQLYEARNVLTKDATRARYDATCPFDPRGEIARRRNEEAYARRKAEEKAQQQAEELRQQEEAVRKAEEERRRATAADAREAAARAARAQNGANAGQANGTGAGATPPPAAGETKTEDKDMKGADATPQETAAEAEERQVRESLERQREEWRKQREAAAAAGEAAPPPGGNTAGENTASPPDPAEQQKLHDLEQLRTDRHNLNESYLNILKEKHLGSSSEAADIEAQRIFHERQDIELELLRRGRAAAEKAAREKEQAERERQAREQAEAAAKEAEAREAEAKAKQEQEQREREAAERAAREAQERVAAEEATKAARAAENRHAAESVDRRYEADVIFELKRQRDPLWKLFARMAQDPNARFAPEEIDLEYKIIAPHAEGNKADIRTARTYHDLLRERAAIPEEWRKEKDPLTWDWGTRGKIEKINVFAHREKLWNRLNDPNDPLSKYKSEVYATIGLLKDEQLPDEYAAAIASGDIDKSVAKMQEAQLFRLKAAEAAQDEFYERTKGRQKTPEEETEGSKLFDERADAMSRLGRLVSVTDPYEPDPFETAPLNDPKAARAREKALWRELDGIRDKKFESLENYKRYERLTRQWSGLRTKLEDAGELEGDPSENEEAPKDPRGRKDPRMGGDDEFVGPPDSRGAWRRHISPMIDKIYENLRHGSEKFKKGTEHLGQRLKDIDRAAVSAGAEKFVRKAGESYNKLPWWSKLAFGGFIAGTMAVTWPVSTVAGMACGGVLGLQRAAGMFGIFVKVEKSLLDARTANLTAGKRKGFVGRFAFDSEKANTNEAAGLAMAYMIGAGGGIGLGVKAAADWLVENIYYNTNITETISARTGGAPPSGAPTQPIQAVTPGSTSPTPGAPEAGTPQTGAQPAPTQSAPLPSGPPAGVDAVTSPPAGSTPDGVRINVEATKGKGYEWMAKRAWEGIQELKQQGLEASELKPGSDMERLYSADASEIDKIVHDIARTRGFYKEDGGTNFRLALGDKLTFNAEGKLELVRGDERFEQPPEGSKFTARYEPGARVGSAPLAEGARPSMAVPGAEPGAFINQNPDAPGVPPEVRAMFRGVETPIEAAPAEELLRQTLPEREPMVGVDLTSQAPASAEAAAAPDAVPQAAPEAVQPATEQPATSAPVSPEQAPAQEIVTQAGERVNLKEPRLFEIEGRRQVFLGGTPQDRAFAIEEYLKNVPPGQPAEVCAPDKDGQYLLTWSRGEDGVVRLEPTYVDSWWGLVKTWMKTPTPTELLKLVK